MKTFILLKERLKQLRSNLKQLRIKKAEIQGTKLSLIKDSLIFIIAKIRSTLAKNI